MTPSLRRGSMSMVVAMVVAACGSPTPTASSAPTASAETASPAPSTSVAASSAPTPAPTTSVVTDSPIASKGAIAVLGADGGLSIVDASGRSVPAGGGGGTVTYGFPTWSPDGSKVASVRTKGSDIAVVILDAKDIANGLPVPPAPIFDKAGVEPFYLYWSPDGKSVTFLATEGTDLALHLAPADGSAPLDGSGPGSVVRSGNPFYYDWVADDRLIAHIGAGPDGFVGQVGLDGKSSAPIEGTPADFRPPVVSHDRKSIAFVRTTNGLESDVVVTALDGSREARLTVLGPTAIAFDPSGDTLGAIGADDVSTMAAFPLGPLKLLDRKGKQRTLLDGLVVSFWWSPDGKTMAAVRVVRTTPDTSPAPVASGATPAPTPTPTGEVHLVFVDVATGKILSDPVIHPAATFVDGILSYFDQYSLSHRMWAPDGASFLMPEVDETGVTSLAVRYADGRPPVMLDGSIGFWSP